MQRRYRVDISVTISEVDGNRSHPQPLNSGDVITQTRVITVKSINELGRILQEVDIIGLHDRDGLPVAG